MASRNLTTKFETLRNQCRSSRSRSPSASVHGREALLPSDSAIEMDRISLSTSLQHSLPPEWVDIVDTIHKDVARVKENIGALQKLHAERLKVFGGNEAEADRDIDILSQEITRLLRKSENNVKRIALVGSKDGTLTAEEKTVRANVMRSLGLDIFNLSKQFRQSQKDFLSRLKGQETVGREIFGDDDQKPLSLEEALDRGLTQEEVLALQESEKTASAREKEILKLAQSINDLSEMFRELSVLVIEQGTIVDRIDYNVEQAMVKVEFGKKELVTANEYSKAMRTMKCICCLLVVIIILIIALVLKKQK